MSRICLIIFGFGVFGCASSAEIVTIVNESGSPVVGAGSYPQPLVGRHQYCDLNGRIRVYRKGFIILKEGYLQEWYSVTKSKEEIVLKSGDNNLVQEMAHDALKSLE